MLYSGEIEGNQDGGKEQTTTISRSELHALGFYNHMDGFSKPVAKAQYGVDEDVAGAETVALHATKSGNLGCDRPDCCMRSEVKLRHETNDSISIVISCSAEDCSTEGIKKATQNIRAITEESLESHEATLGRYSSSEV